MYDKNQIEDSLEFCRQIKDFYGSEDSLPEVDPITENNTEELFANLASNMDRSDRPWESVLQETGSTRADFGEKNDIVPEPVIQIPIASNEHDVDALLQKENNEKKQKEEAQRHAREVAYARAEALRKAAEEEKRKQAEEAARIEASKKAAQEASQQRKEKEAALARAKAEEEERRRQAEILEQKKREAELVRQQRLQEEEAKRRQQAMIAEQKRLQEQLAEQKRRKAEEAERQRQLALAEQKRREAEEAERQRQLALAEQKRREAEEAERQRQLALAEQKRREAEEAERQRQAALAEQKRREAEEAERQRQLALAEQKRREAEEAERQRQAAELQQVQPMAQMHSQADAETIRLQQRAAELQRQAEIAALEARMHQLELETQEARQRYQEIGQGTSSPVQDVQASISPITLNPVSQTSKKLSKEEIDEIFARELQKSQEDNEAIRKERLKRHAEKVRELSKQQQSRREKSQQWQPVLEKVIDIKDMAVDAVRTVIDFVQEKSSDPETKDTRTKFRRIANNLLVIAICVLIAYLLASAVTSFVAHPTKVEGESMETTLTDGDTVIIQKMSYYFHDPERYDVVVFPVPYYNSDTKYIKRVIGLPGETVQIVDGKVYINGEELKDDHYGKEEKIEDPGDAAEPITLADDEYFVLGDNRNMSTDSRSGYVGLIRRKNITGEAWGRVWPFSKFGSIE